MFVGRAAVGHRGPGVLGGVAYLTRTAALPLVMAVPAVYAMRREWRHAAFFVAGHGSVSGWLGMWIGGHMAKAAMPTCSITSTISGTGNIL